jgi:chaperonin cofactor prefoldin
VKLPKFPRLKLALASTLGAFIVGLITMLKIKNAKEVKDELKEKKKDLKRQVDMARNAKRVRNMPVDDITSDLNRMFNDPREDNKNP